MFSSDPVDWLLAAASLAMVIFSTWQFRRSRRADAAYQRRYERLRAESRRLEERVARKLRELENDD